MKLCKDCLCLKEETEFYKHSQNKDGLLNFCKDCKRDYARKNRSKEKDKALYKKSPRRRLRTIFFGMLKRCYSKEDTHFKFYGAKGVLVERKDFNSFYFDMVESYIEHRNKNGSISNRQTQIDRINPYGNYSKENCRRITAGENSRNRRK